MTDTPKEAALKVEAILRESGYLLGDLTFTEIVGGRVATYDFGSGNHITTRRADGVVHVADAEPISMRESP